MTIGSRGFAYEREGRVQIVLAAPSADLNIGMEIDPAAALGFAAQIVFAAGKALAHSSLAGGGQGGGATAAEAVRDAAVESSVVLPFPPKGAA